MADERTGEEASLETRADAGEGEAGLVKLWKSAIELADKEESDWRERGREVVKIYRDAEAAKKYRDKGYRFNILYSNVETLGPAIYNSTPKPDVRRRFSDKDPNGRIAAQVLERALSVQIETGDLDQALRQANKDNLLPGRGVTRVRYEPTTKDGKVLAQEISFEHVHWEDFRRGPARKWSDLPWIAFRHYLTREQVIKLAPEIGATIPLDCTLDGRDAEKGEMQPDLFKRLLVWEVWDKEQREILFIAPSYAAGPITRQQDVLNLKGFFPIPRALYALRTSDTLEPVEEYRIYKDQAEELDRITRRITVLISVLKWRGVRDVSVPGFEQLADAEDGELVPSENVYQYSQAGGGLDKAVWLMPIETLIKVIQSLYQQREQIKFTIYEIMGVADILRGQSDPNETLGAQNIKAQWGSIRIQERQADVQRFARDLLRIAAEIIAEKFDPALLGIMTGIQLTPEVIKIMRSDALRMFHIDIETDSTVQADMAGAQRNMGEFVQGFGAFVQAIGPAVQAGVVPVDAATDILTGFARIYKLGRQAEDALDRIGGERGPDGLPIADPNKPQQPNPQQQAQAAAQAEQQAAQQKSAMEMQAKQQAAAMDAQNRQMELQHADDKHRQAMAQKQEAFALDQKLKRVGANNEASEEAGLEPDDQDPRIGVQMIAQLIAQSMQQTAQIQAQQTAIQAQQMEILARISEGMDRAQMIAAAPRKSVLERDPSGRPVSATSVPVLPRLN